MGSLVDTTYVSVDVEAAGPNPSEYSLLAIGACLAFDPASTVSVELHPVSEAFTSEALAVGELDLERLRAQGVPAEQAMREFDEWVSRSTPRNQRPVFVGFNAAFDWMFVADYFHRFLGRNPFGYKALDIKALFLGATAAPWDETGFEDIATHYGLEQRTLSHDALDDALVQAALFRSVLGELAEGATP